MMMVRCFIGPSALDGMGVFTDTDIPAGRLVWVFDSRFDLTYDRDELDRVPRHFREFLERYTYDHPSDPDRVVLDSDEGRYMNHSEDPNVEMSEAFRGVARRFIPAGAELTCACRRFTQGALVFDGPRHRARASAG